MSETSDFDPWTFFKEETGHEDVVVRTEAMENLVCVAALMEPAVVRDEMVPYLLSKYLTIVFSAVCV